MAESLREQLAAAADQITARNDAPEPVITDEPAKADAAPVDTPKASEPDKPGRTFGRERDEQGRLKAGPAKRDAPHVSATVKTAPAAPSAAVAPAAPVEVKPAKPKPTTWRKEMDAHWATLPPEIQEEIHRREGDYAKGVSTYKGEWERAKPILESIAPYMPMFEQHGVNVPQQMAKYAEIHRALALGDENSKLAIVAQIARDYKIPIQNLFAQGQDGSLQVQPQYQNVQPQGITPQEIEQIVRQQMQQTTVQSEIQQFQNAKGADGQAMWPHFEQVKGTMAGLLQAGLANDLADAYKRSLLMPEHASILEQERAEQRAAQEEKESRERQAQAQRARAGAVSVKTQTPSVPSGPDKPKGLRQQLEAQFAARSGGRV